MAVQVLELTSNPQVDTWALKECIENDPALTTRILRVVNSSLFGLSREVSDLNQALALLGTKPLKLLVLSFSLPAGLFAGMSGAMAGRYWQRTLTKAVAARELAQLLWKAPGDEAFTAGLLQDLGMLVLIQDVGTPYVRLLEKALAVGASPCRGRAAIAGVRSRGPLGPAAGAVGPAGEPGRGGGLGPAAVAAAAADGRLLRTARGALCRADCATGRRRQRRRPGRSVERRRAASRLPRTGHCDNLIRKLQEKVGQLAEVLSLDLPPGKDFLQEVLLRSQAQLAEVAGIAAGDLVRLGVDRQTSAEPDLGFEIGLLAEAVQRRCRGAGQPLGLRWPASRGKLPRRPPPRCRINVPRRPIGPPARPTPRSWTTPACCGPWRWPWPPAGRPAAR